MELRSDAIKRGLARAPHRSLLAADGLTDEELDRPLVAVVSAQNEVIPGHLHLQQIADAVKAGVRMAGGTPLQVNTIGVCDGIAMRGRDGSQTDLNSLFDAVGQVTAGTMTEEECSWLEKTACPTCGSCSGMFTANSICCLAEALGIALPGNGTVPAVYSERIRLAKQVGMKVMELV